MFLAASRRAPVPGFERRISPAVSRRAVGGLGVVAPVIGAGARAEQAEVRYRGVLLRDLLDAAGVQKLDRYALRHSGVVARASDDYAVLFSWGELYNGRAGDSVLVITSMNGKPLPPAEGPYALRSLSDTKPGPRHVKWLNRIAFFTLPKQALPPG